jgi:hypothetical protein
VFKLLGSEATRAPGGAGGPIYVSSQTFDSAWGIYPVASQFGVQFFSTDFLNIIVKQPVIIPLQCWLEPVVSGGDSPPGLYIAEY